jgi:cytochrome c551/c552
VDSASLASFKEVAQAYSDREGANRRLAESKKSLADCWGKAKTFSDLNACPAVDPALTTAIDNADKGEQSA